jgi:hypothetical protein
MRPPALEVESWRFLQGQKNRTTIFHKHAKSHRHGWVSSCERANSPWLCLWLEARLVSQVLHPLNPLGSSSINGTRRRRQDSPKVRASLQSDGSRFAVAMCGGGRGSDPVAGTVELPVAAKIIKSVVQTGHLVADDCACGICMHHATLIRNLKHNSLFHTTASAASFVHSHATARSLVQP